MRPFVTRFSDRAANGFLAVQKRGTLGAPHPPGSGRWHKMARLRVFFGSRVVPPGPASERGDPPGNLHELFPISPWTNAPKLLYNLLDIHGLIASATMSVFRVPLILLLLRGEGART